MEAKHRANEYEKGCELDEHGSGLDQVSMPKNCRNSNAPHSRRASQEFRSIYPTGTKKQKKKKQQREISIKIISSYTLVKQS